MAFKATNFTIFRAFKSNVSKSIFGNEKIWKLNIKNIFWWIKKVFFHLGGGCKKQIPKANRCHMSIYLQLRLIFALISSEKKKGNITLYMLRENINDFVIFRNFRTKTRVSGDNFWKVCVCTMGWEFFQFGVLKNRYLQILAKIKTVWLKLSWVKLYASTVFN